MNGKNVPRFGPWVYGVAWLILGFSVERESAMFDWYYPLVGLLGACGFLLMGHFRKPLFRICAAIAALILPLSRVYVLLWGLPSLTSGTSRTAVLAWVLISYSIFYMYQSIRRDNV